MNSDNLNQDLGFNLKAARSDKAWSLDVCSARTGVSKAMLGQIERGESSPTIAKLWKIANGFELPLSYFLAKHSTISPAIAAPVSTSEQDISFVTLFPFDSATAMEVFEITLERQHQHISEPHNDGVVEHIIVIKGAMEYFIDGVWHQLPQGATVKFDACQPHGYRNVTSQPAVFHNIICYG